MKLGAPLLLRVRLVRVVARMLPALAVAIVVVFAASLFGLSESLMRQAWVVGLFIVGFRLISSLVSEVLSPYRVGMRLIEMPDHRAKRWTSTVRVLLWVLLGTEVAIYLVRANNWSESVAALLGLIRTSGLIVFGAMAVWRSATFRNLIPKDTDTLPHLLRWLSVRVAFPLLVLGAFAFAIAHSLGYVALAEWAARNILTSVVMLFSAVLIYRWIRDRIQQAVQFVRDEKREGGNEPSPAFIGVERISLGGIRLLIWIMSIVGLLSTWHIGLDWIQSNGDQPLFGAFGPKLGPFVRGMGSMMFALVIGALVRNILIFFVFPSAGVEVGIRYAILTLLRYLVMVIAALFGFGAFGMDTSTLAVFAGAFGVGLAFGLQDIFANFFSGLIMLIEQPVRVGDAVEVGGTSGHIEAIRLRGTVIRTFDKTSVTIPNRQLIGERVTNLSHNMDTARISVLVGAGYGSDPTLVKETLMNVANNDSRVFEPVVRLETFGASSVDYSLRCFTKAVGDRFAIGSDLRSAVLVAFDREGIEIPFPQSDIRITHDSRYEEARVAAEKAGVPFPFAPPSPSTSAKSATISNPPSPDHPKA